MAASYYVYILRSLNDGSYYKGYTQDYQKRLLEHNSGQSRYTSGKGPWELIYVEIHQSKSKALIRERKLKRCKADYFEWLKSQPTNILR